MILDELRGALLSHAWFSSEEERIVAGLDAFAAAHRLVDADELRKRLEDAFAENAIEAKFVGYTGIQFAVAMDDVSGIIEDALTEPKEADDGQG